MRPAIFPKSIISLLGLLALGIWLTTAPSSRAQEATDQATADSGSPAVTDAATADTAPSDTGTTTSSAAASAGSAPTDEAPTGTGAAGPGGGLMNFQTDLFTGRFNYRLPLVVPPARGNSQPSLALGYSSGGGNGWCGIGWMLDLGYIQRDVRYGVPIGWTNGVPKTYYDDSKGFVFNLGGAESRLVNVSGSEYRAEVETGAFLKFVYNAGSATWTVTDKAGNTFCFGEQPANRMENPNFTSPPTAGGKVFRWALNRAEDANGNKTVISYTTDSNQLYLAQIQYNLSTKGTFTPHTVNFGMLDRSDTMISYLTGYRVTTRKLLNTVTITAGGQSVRKYSITYTNSPSTFRSIIAQVTEYGTDFTNALPAMRFSYPLCCMSSAER